MAAVLRALAGGDRRSIGKSNQVVRRVLKDPRLLAAIIDGLAADDPLVRMRCADVAEKVSAVQPAWLQPHKAKLLKLATRAREQELRWHAAQMLPRLKLTAKERARAIAAMFAYLDDQSRIVKTFALQALVDFAEQDTRLRRRVMPRLLEFRRTGSPAMRSRARRLVRRLLP